ncbi:tetratricopeptide repeat protein [Roseivirga sp. BDSF3-8]|uniref:tetratricopeptide repeat protein n=1 Tax=Roseivirga sp. BDSF3-8 TaxID=3241598 RepID=UPI00353218B7
MKTQKFNNITVRRYLRNEMSRQEEAAFKKILEEDPQFAGKVALDKQLIKGATLGLHLRAPAIKLHKPVIEKQAPARPYGMNNLYVWGAFAAALILLAATVVLLMNSKVETATIYSRHYRPFIDRSAALETKYQKPVEAYENGFYDQAVQGMDNVLIFEPKDVTANFYKGLALLAGGNTEKAIAHLTTASELMPFSDRGPVLYYLGLAHLKNGDAHAAREALEGLNAFENMFRVKSNEILNSL